MSKLRQHARKSSGVVGGDARSGRGDAFEHPRGAGHCLYGVLVGRRALHLAWVEDRIEQQRRIAEQGKLFLLLFGDKARQRDDMIDFR